MKRIVLLAAAALSAALLAASRSPAQGKGEPDVDLTVVAVEYRGTKLWLPGTIVAEKGDRVRLTLLNKIPGDVKTHGFAIDAFGVKEVVLQDEPKTVEFVADKKGVFPMYCHQHPAHVGGQVVVLR